MQRNHFLLLKKIKITSSAQLCNFGPQLIFREGPKGPLIWQQQTVRHLEIVQLSICGVDLQSLC